MSGGWNTIESDAVGAPLDVDAMTMSLSMPTCCACQELRLTMPFVRVSSRI